MVGAPTGSVLGVDAVDETVAATLGCADPVEAVAPADATALMAAVLAKSGLIAATALMSLGDTVDIDGGNVASDASDAVACAVRLVASV